MNLPSDLQRYLPYVVVAVLAVAGLLLVVRGLDTSGGGGGTTPPAPPRIVQPDNTGRPGGDTGRGSRKTDRRPVTKRSSQAYLGCVEQATDTTALERCQAFLPRR